MREEPLSRDIGGSPSAGRRPTAPARPVRDTATQAGPPAPSGTEQPASLGKRAGAYIIDYLAVGVLLAVIGVRAGIVPVAAETMTREQAYVAGAIASVALLLYFVALEAAFGQTLAKRLLGIRVVMTDGSRVTVRAAFTRRVLFVAGMLVPLVGALFSFAVPLTALVTAIQDEPAARGFHDRWARTRVLESSLS